MAKEWDQLQEDEKFRFKALAAGLRSSFHNLNALYTSDDASMYLTAAEAKQVLDAEGIVLQVILSLRRRGLTV